MKKQITSVFFIFFISFLFSDTIKYREKKLFGDYKDRVVTDVEFLGVSREGLHYQKSTFFGNVLKTITCANVDEILDSNNIIINYSCLEFTYEPEKNYDKKSVDLTEVSIFSQDITIDELESFRKKLGSDFPSKSYILLMSKQQKIDLYDEYQINKFSNTLISAVLPTYGHYKVNKWKRGLIILSLNILAYFLNDADLDLSSDRGPAPDGVTESETKKYAQVFSVILLGDTYYQTSIYNKNLSNIIFSTENSTQ